MVQHPVQHLQRPAGLLHLQIGRREIESRLEVRRVVPDRLLHLREGQLLRIDLGLPLLDRPAGSVTTSATWRL